MPSVKSPNKPPKSAQVGASKARKAQKKRSALGQSGISRSASRRGARPGLLPTSGPGALLSAKKRRKVEKQMVHALKRKMEAEGEVLMKDASEQSSQKMEKKANHDGDAKDVEAMEVNIS